MYFVTAKSDSFQSTFRSICCPSDTSGHTDEKFSKNINSRITLGELQSQNFRAMCNSGGRGSARDLFDFVGFRRSLNLPVRAKIDFAVLLRLAPQSSTSVAEAAINRKKPALLLPLSPLLPEKFGQNGPAILLHHTVDNR